MSCSSSSNIRSSLVTTIITQEGDGNRVAFKLNDPGDGPFSSGITGGSVIRWDAGLQGWTLSSAHEPASAEVVGVVESISFPPGATQYVVVASGLINYPTLSSVINRYDGETFSCVPLDGNADGGEGGADVMFLSDGCFGKLQYMEPIIPGHIVKPVIQRVKVGTFNGIVLNYIGYEVADTATIQLQSLSPPGEVKYSEDLGEISGFIKVSTEQLAAKSDYPELYEKFQTNYGKYEETVKLSQTVPSLGLYVNSTVTQTNPYGNIISAGKIKRVDTAANTITIEKEFGQPKTDISKNIRLGNTRVGISSTDVSSFTIPAIPTQKTRYSSTDKQQEVTLVPYMRTTKEIGAVAIPKTVVIDKVESDTVVANGVDVGNKLSNLETRLNTIEKRLG